LALSLGALLLRLLGVRFLTLFHGGRDRCFCRCEVGIGGERQAWVIRRNTVVSREKRFNGDNNGADPDQSSTSSSASTSAPLDPAGQGMFATTRHGQARRASTAS
jgi:hypothetical protein